MEELSEYEAMRESNRLLLQKEYDTHFEGVQLPALKRKEFSETERPRKSRKFNHKLTACQPFRMSLRSAGKSPNIDYNYADSFLEELENKPSIKRFGKPLRRSLPTIRFRPSIPVPNMKRPSEITENDISNICYMSAAKVYDAVNGTTCHQCRQKTQDFKSICKNPLCNGVRGQFCGFCLEKRYGEDVAVVVMKDDWSCPPCRNICNCSICRKKLGKRPTGILAPIVISQGYSNVKDFLLEKEPELDYYLNSEEEIDEKEKATQIDLDENSEHKTTPIEENTEQKTTQSNADDELNRTYSSDEDDFLGFDLNCSHDKDFKGFDLSDMFKNHKKTQ